ncbi:hypothetical protein C8D92_10327 [Tamilnaduibacter salinus]|uniref:Uncharacterized protein n=1 Tax=Tamilnaduibacter salinus TaxID=1484056 RepID=A0A2A2I2H7_9GAMM|nr:hypothetical protein [Tamilnaduibacter salinus]PAV25516.1 hypothetical protein CF392_10530 [Tamilnaduibacter salinus]PVY77343.1 hypothetical protein C8D92_10327 [Tamilnaduibacter salinus]
MNGMIVWIALGLAAILAIALIQKRRKDQSLGALKRSGFRPDQHWSSAISLVTEQGTKRFAIVWPGDYRVYDAHQLLGVDLKSHEIDEGGGQHKVVLRLEDPDHHSVALPTGNNRRRAEQWAEEIRAWHRSLR